VRKALELAADELNEALIKTQGRITKLDVNIDFGIKSTVRIIVVVDESDIKLKRVLWANEAGGNEETALNRAREKINEQLSKLHGEVAGFYIKFISPALLKRTYATLLVAVNEEIPEKVGKLDSSERRERLAAALKLFGNDPKAINLAQMAKIFGVSRDTIYKDLHELGIER
jgi:predicted HTH domain antitoxin